MKKPRGQTQRGFFFVTKLVAPPRKHLTHQPGDTPVHNPIFLRGEQLN
jgi:hypothetical protein